MPYQQKEKTLREAANNDWEIKKYIVRTHYHILPTSKEWQDMTEDQIRKEYYLITESFKSAHKSNKKTVRTQDSDEDSDEQEHWEDPNFDLWDKETDEQDRFIDESEIP